MKLIFEKPGVPGGNINEPYVTVVVFEDLHGNLWDLIDPGTVIPT